MSAQLFLTGVVFLIAAVVAGVLDYNDTGYNSFPVWRVIWILLAVVVIVLWLIAIWSNPVRYP